MLRKLHNAGLIAFALAGLLLAAPSYGKKDKDPKDYKDKSSKDYSSKDYSSKDYSSKGSSSKDYNASLISSDPNAKSSSTSTKMSSTEKYLLHIHDVLASGDDEWQVLRPRVEKVVTLQREVTAGRDPKGPRPPSSKDLARLAADANGTSSKPVSQVSDSTKALNIALADQAARLQDVRMSIAAARDARAKAKTELTRAQEDLRGLLTIRQEAAMIVMGLLD